MKQTKIIMGMPITVEVLKDGAERDIESVFAYFRSVDEKYSTYKPASEISKINNGLAEKAWSQEMKLVLKLCEETKKLTRGYFDIEHDGRVDPSGLVKGWAINNAAKLLAKKGVKNFYIEAGGDIQVHGTNADNKPWAIGVRNPFNIQEIIKVVGLTNGGVATSGSYIRGQHIYNPNNANKEVNTVRSLTVIGPNIYEADRYATAAFAMGREGISFIGATPGLEGYMVDANKTATYTDGFERYVANDA
jgi:thiamine biosynthesis lipoprotein